MDYLNRKASTLASELWERVDEAAAEAARPYLTARRVLELEGPLGPGVTTVEGWGDRAMGDQSRAGGVEILVGAALPVPLLRKRCGLGIRGVAAGLEGRTPMDLSDLEDAAEEVARQEERLIYEGLEEAGLPGLMTAPGHLEVAAGDWSAGTEAVEAVLRAVKALDEAGNPGPYALVLPAWAHGILLGRHSSQSLLLFDHVSRICTLGVFKTCVDRMAVVDPRAGRIVLGHDLLVGYIGQDGARYQVQVMESLVLRLEEPGAVCVMT